MRQAVMTKPGEIHIQSVSEPSCGPNQVKLRIKRIGVCGSDIHVYHGQHPFTPYPVVQGHEFSGEVVEKGDQVPNIKIGDQVTATPQLVCKTCPPCQRGDHHICDNLKVKGFQAPGVAQDFFVAEADDVAVLPQSLTLEQGALVEPIAVAVHALKRARPINNQNLVVLGAGPIGNLVAQTARAKGARVLITDISDFRLEIARKCGIETAINPKTRNLGDLVYQIAIECSGAEPALTQTLETIEKGGQLILVGVFEENPRVNVNLIQDRELELKGSLMYQMEDYLEAIQLLEKGQVVTDPLITTHFPFEQYLDAYRYIDKQRDQCMKVMIDL